MVLKSVLWLGGSPCSGKSSAAEWLSARYGLARYHCDKQYDRHVAQARPDIQPVMCRVGALVDDALWMRPVSELLQDEKDVYREEFAMIADDLRTGQGVEGEGEWVLAEGAALLPDLVFNLCGTDARAVWMVPSAEFQLEHYGLREWAKEVVARCRDPEAAFEHWMQRDIGFAHWVALRAQRLDYACLRVDGSTTLEENGCWVEKELSLISA